MINVGDRVTVYFERVEGEYNVEVVTVPLGAHEAWEMKRLDGTILYISQYSKMIRVNPLPKPTAALGAKQEAIRGVGTIASVLAAGAKESTGEGPNYPKKGDD